MKTNGTYANKSTDTSGLGEYSSAQLLKELELRGLSKTFLTKEEVIANSRVSVLTLRDGTFYEPQITVHGKYRWFGNAYKSASAAKRKLNERVREIIGE